MWESASLVHEAGGPVLRLLTSKDGRSGSFACGVCGSDVCGPHQPSLSLSFLPVRFQAPARRRLSRPTFASRTATRSTLARTNTGWSGSTPRTSTLRPKCDAEHQRGGLARARLQKIVEGGKLDFTENVCPCPPGTHGTWFCNYGRKCGTLLAADGENAGLILIREGHARAFTCGKYAAPGAKAGAGSRANAARSSVGLLRLTNEASQLNQFCQQTMCARRLDWVGAHYQIARHQQHALIQTDRPSRTPKRVARPSSTISISKPPCQIWGSFHKRSFTKIYEEGAWNTSGRSDQKLFSGTGSQ